MTVNEPRLAVRRIAIPATQNPFVNTCLLPAGLDDDGEDRFWISSWNNISGSLGLLVSETGRYRRYSFGPEHPGFYSAVVEDTDTLWLCGNLSHVVRLSLRSGEFQSYDTGAPSGLMFQGMVIDPVEGKLFSAAFAPPVPTAFSFDLRTKRAARLYQGVCEQLYQCSGFANGDGTHTTVMYNPGVALLHWDPRAESVHAIPLDVLTANQHVEPPRRAGFARVISDDTGATYLPSFGWYVPGKQMLDPDGSRPAREMTWFARRGRHAWGVRVADGDAMIAVGEATVSVWDLDTGVVTDLCRIPDAGIHNVALTRTGKIVAVSAYGEFSRFDAYTGALELVRRLPSASVGHADCVTKADDNHVLGTTFISQRFWQIDLDTEQGYDCGRAAPGGGQVTQAWKIANRVYMTAYTGGELVEYEPQCRPRFPENPRVVAKPPTGMRPVAGAHDGRFLYYSCSHRYGRLGCVLTRYDTQTGEVRYLDDPLPGLMIGSVCHHAPSHTLLAGTTVEADCESARPTRDRAWIAQIDPDNLAIRQTAPGAPGSRTLRVLGPLSQSQYLCKIDHHDGVRRHHQWRSFDLPDFGFGDVVTPPDDTGEIVATGIAGLFILRVGERTELWDLLTMTMLSMLCDERNVYRCHVQDDDVYLTTPDELVLLEGCLAGFRQTNDHSTEQVSENRADAERTKTIR